MSESPEQTEPDPHQVVLSTTDSEASAAELANGIVRERLAACVQIVGPITSVFPWEGDVQQDTEWQLWIKTAGDRLEALSRWVQANHPYDVPELVALPVLGGSSEYLKWVTDETRPVRP